MAIDDRLPTARRGARVITAAAVAFSLLFGCDSSEVSLSVDVRTDLVAGTEIAALIVELPDEGLMERRSLQAGDESPHRSAEWAALPPNAERRLVVSAEDRAGRIVVSRTALVDHRLPTLATVVLTRSCVGVTCAGGETCIGGQCTDERCLNGDDPACAEDLCGPCDALSACDDAACEEGVCLHQAASDRCRAVEVCVPDRGCLPVISPPPDAGMPDAGPLDAGPLDAGPLDAGPLPCTPPDGECDYLLQNCPEGRSCVPRTSDSGSTSRCVAAGSGMDVMCTSSTECAVGWDCIGGLCVEVCCSGSTEALCSLEGATCGFDISGVGGHCFADTCDPATQTGCPTGDACYVVGLGTAACLDEGSTSLGEPCVGTNECRAGAGCSSGNECAAYCNTSGLDCAGSLEQCIVPSGEAIGQCEEMCDPISGAGCTGARSCYPFDANQAACFPIGVIAVGDPCTQANHCRDGLACLTGFCERICDLAAPECGGQTCTPVVDLPPWALCL